MTIVHHSPRYNEGKMRCCDRTPFEVPVEDRITQNLTLVTCPGRAVADEAEKIAEASPDLERGLYPKYDVIDRRTGELVTEPVFVLKPDTDPIAKAALQFYAARVDMEGYKQLADDLYAWLIRPLHTSEKVARAVLEEKQTRTDIAPDSAMYKDPASDVDRPLTVDDMSDEIMGDQAIVNLLSLVCVDVTSERVHTWMEAEKLAVQKWAWLMHLEASDNECIIPPKPGCLG